MGYKTGIKHILWANSKNSLNNSPWPKSSVIGSLLNIIGMFIVRSHFYSGQVLFVSLSGYIFLCFTQISFEVKSIELLMHLVSIPTYLQAFDLQHVACKSRRRGLKNAHTSPITNSYHLNCTRQAALI